MHWTIFRQLITERQQFIAGLVAYSFLLFQELGQGRQLNDSPIRGKLPNDLATRNVQMYIMFSLE
jgi:hypothetical protein